VRSCITRCALAVSFQSVGSSASAFNSASRAFDLSKSKMPPQQPDRPLDILDHRFDFAAHDRPIAARAASVAMYPLGRFGAMARASL
jgi:hypothetical protein